ncbi:hypothetical protein H5410_029984 [Solanum commersonii]|uniref:DUF1985 domain-containing protein n=1 Tax=Solanum commersonii TaxID=4109 RepID=A0A9J5YHY9_SOLCO|nr:hypothetical protein H5410_029984 [Solanum commersonii]
MSSDNSDEQVQVQSDEVLLLDRQSDEEAKDFYVKNPPTKAPHFQCVFNNDIKANLIKYLHEHACKVFREKFALISGLNCVSDEKDFKFDTQEPNRLMSQYFWGVKLIREIDLMERFQGKVWGDNDQDGLKFAILIFIQTVIFSGEKRTKKVSRLHFDLVESGRYNHFPWSLSKKLDSSKKFYKIGGMPIVIQVWLYECSSSIDIQVAQKVDDHIPRLLN